MPAATRSNPLALAVLVTLHERPMHPYEVSTVLRERRQHESVRLNFGSLYAVVASLERRGLVEAAGTEREGNLPERTVYRLTDAGRCEAHAWLSSLLDSPASEFPSFGAGLALLPALAPHEVRTLLGVRLAALEARLAAAREARRVNEDARVPRLIWVEDEFRTVLLEAELEYVRRLSDSIDDGSLDGLAWWKSLHGAADAPKATADGVR